ncbi:K(+) efflux antiporter 6 [Citrus sinensis]|uniref:K(+) efflux antiporter 6 n=1 Tax=Citrus sinensis TaxID=2711 RepID=A0ACB8NUA6_CITSI|nr:K(+) efflux antiporter 6 [Citrus sinensis]
MINKSDYATSDTDINTNKVKNVEASNQSTKIEVEPSISIEKICNHKLRKIFHRLLKVLHKVQNSIKTLLAMVALLDLKLEQIDVKTAFLHGNLEENILMPQPKDGAVYLLLYIDDILIVGKNSGGIEKLKNLLKREFKMKDFGNAKRILGIDILRDRATDFGNAKRILGIDILRDRATGHRKLDVYNGLYQSKHSLCNLKSSWDCVQTDFSWRGLIKNFILIWQSLLRISYASLQKYQNNRSCFASTNSVTKLDSKISATATATTTELNNTGSKEGSFANMIDRALEKKFNKSEQNEAADPGSFNNMLSDSMLVTFNHVFNLDNKNGAEDTPTFIYRKILIFCNQDSVFIIVNPMSTYPMLQLELRLISDLVVLIVSATCGGIAFVCSGQPVIIGYLLVGSVIGPRGFSFVSEMVLVETVAQFGVIFLPFALGLEFSMAKWIFVPSLKNIDDFLKLKICPEALS